MEMTKRFLLALVLAASAAVAAGGARADVSQTPVATGCPAGYAHMSLDELLAAGPYFVARRVDAAGNDNGSVCALALPEAARLALCGASCPVPVLYQFTDDDNPAKLNAQVGR
jgi:hypothetical protein